MINHSPEGGNGLSENLKKLFKINIYEKLKFKFEGIPDPY
jgi:hypothetical protein